MASATFNIDQTLNNSLKIGDSLYFCEHNVSFYGWQGAAAQYDEESNPHVKIGSITSISDSSITVDSPTLKKIDLPGGVYYDTTGYQNPENYFLFFSKNNAIELTRLKGYYASVKFVNNSKEKAELFNVGAEIVRSSK